MTFDPRALILSAVLVATILVAVKCREWHIGTPMGPP